MRRVVFLALVMIGLLLLAGRVFAMGSTNYQLDWFTPLDSNAGGAATSTHYAIQLTLGQSAYQASASTNYGVCLGYWCRSSDGAVEHNLYLPLVLHSVP
ncbi:MAG: hypothetical protein JXA21_26830 [Anaerolineae bacterium]|nr:hypothetical protein [Anaerolineae bacterium]